MIVARQFLRSVSVVRRTRSFLTAAVIALATVAACGDTATTDNDDTFRVALLTSGPISDKSWNGGAYDGLMAIRDSLGAKVSHIETRTPAEFEENFRQYGAQGYDLVIGHGFEFQDAALRVAPDYPNTKFVCTSGNATAPNVAGMNFAFEESSFQAGMIAGALSGRGIIGAIGGTELPPVRASFTAFERGAKFMRPDITVLTSYIGNWEDVSAGKEQALAQIGRGADIIYQNANAAGLGIFQAAREKGVYTIGSNANQNAIAPEVTIGSVVIDLTRALMMVARDVQGGTFSGKPYQMGVQVDVVKLVLNPDLESRVSAELRARVDSVGKAILDGTFHELDDLVVPADKRTALSSR